MAVAVVGWATHRNDVLEWTFSSVPLVSNQIIRKSLLSMLALSVELDSLYKAFSMRASAKTLTPCSCLCLLSLKKAHGMGVLFSLRHGLCCCSAWVASFLNPPIAIISFASYVVFKLSTTLHLSWSTIISFPAVSVDASYSNHVSVWCSLSNWVFHLWKVLSSRVWFLGRLHFLPFQLLNLFSQVFHSSLCPYKFLTVYNSIYPYERLLWSDDQLLFCGLLWMGGIWWQTFLCVDLFSLLRVIITVYSWPIVIVVSCPAPSFLLYV